MDFVNSRETCYLITHLIRLDNPLLNNYPFSDISTFKEPKFEKQPTKTHKQPSNQKSDQHSRRINSD